MNYKDILEQRLAAMMPISLLNHSLRANKVTSAMPTGRIFDDYEFVIGKVSLYVCIHIGYVVVYKYSYSAGEYIEIGRVTWKQYGEKYYYFYSITGLKSGNKIERLEKRMIVDELVEHIYNIWKNA